MTNLYMGGEDLPDDYVDENGAHYKVDKPIQEDKRTWNDFYLPSNSTSFHRLY